MLAALPVAMALFAVGRSLLSLLVFALIFGIANGLVTIVRGGLIRGPRLSLGNPAEVAALALRRAFWGEGTYGRVAPPAAIKRLQRADVQALQAQWLRPHRVALVLVGDVTPEQAQALAQRLLGDWRAPATTSPAPITAPLVLIDRPGSGQSGVALAAPYIGNSAAEAPDRYVGLVANAVLGGGYSARLNQAVRIKRGLGYGTASSVDRHAGCFRIAAMIFNSPPQFGQCAKSISNRSQPAVA